MSRGCRTGLPTDITPLERITPWRSSSRPCSSRPTAWPRSTRTGTSRTSTRTWAAPSARTTTPPTCCSSAARPTTASPGRGPTARPQARRTPRSPSSSGTCGRWSSRVSRSQFTWRNSELVDGDLVAAVTALKADPGVKGILIPGSISVVQQLLAAGLVDELRLLVHPVAARKGRKLFDDGDTPYHLTVTAAETFPTGVIRVIYAPTAAPGQGRLRRRQGPGARGQRSHRHPHTSWATFVTRRSLSTSW